MSVRKRTLYDTRFIAAIYYPNNQGEATRIRRELMSTLSRYISSLTVYETYKISLENEGKQTADLRAELLKQDFSIVNVDWAVAKQAALIWKNYRVPVADAIIAATAVRMKIPLVTNDPHILEIRELRSRWV